MSDQPTRELSATERKEQEDSIIAHYERMIRLQKPKTQLAQLKRDEAVATREELVALMDFGQARKRLRELALNQKVVTEEELAAGTSGSEEHFKNPLGSGPTPKTTGPDRN